MAKRHKKSKFVNVASQGIISIESKGNKTLKQVDKVSTSYKSNLLQKAFYDVTYTYKFIDSSRTCALTLEGTETIWDAELGYLNSWESTKYIEFYTT